jgi:pimeloyl-ACP methyl ester carboxylesterase
MTEHVTSEDGTTIAFDRHGDGQPVVVLVEPPLRHRAFSAFDGLVPLLAEQLSVITYDRRGRGDSGDAAVYHPDREVEDLLAVITATGGAAGVYGYSAGALLAVRAAGHAGASRAIHGLVLLEPPLHDDGDPRPDPLTLEMEELVGVDPSAAVRRFHAAVGVPDEVVDELAASAAWAQMVEAAHTLVHDCVLSDSIDRAVLERVAVPTLVLDSEGSSDDLTGWAATAAARIPAATSRSLPGEWHTVADEVLAPVIVEHLRASGGRASV